MVVDMGQYAGLGWKIEPFAHVVDEGQQFIAAVGAVAGGIDADHGVAAAEQKAVDDARQNALGVVSGVIGLETGGEAP